jgi:hypothetical protein
MLIVWFNEKLTSKNSTYARAISAAKKEITTQNPTTSVYALKSDILPRFQGQ